MADALEKQVISELRKGVAKKTILKKLDNKENHDDLVWNLNHYPTGKGRQDNLWINWFLCIVLLGVTINKLYFVALVQMNAASVNQFSPLLLLDLIVPAVNFFILTKIVRFHYQGYQFMAVLGVLGLIRPENRLMPNLAMYLVIIGLSVFLMLRLFPKQKRIAY